MEPQPKSLPKLFDAVKAKFPARLEPERWYLVAASALVTCSDPFHVGQLYAYLTKQPEYASPDGRRFLNKRLREFVMKQWVNIGVPKAAIALYALMQEEEGDADLTFTKSHIHLDAVNHEKGKAFINMLYGPERAAEVFTEWGKDFEWLAKDIVYGMFYADVSVLDFMATELITYIAIVCQGIPVPNHMEGLRRMGLSVEEIEQVTECGKLVAKWAGHDMMSWPDVRTVLAEAD